jgi:hypothetical protein
MPMNRKEYPPNWNAISKRIRFERAGGRCEDCEAINGDPNPKTGSIVVLTVAHKDHNLKNNDGLDLDINAPLLPEPKSNLAALCQADHLARDIWEHSHSRKYGRDTKRLNYDLFKKGD